MKNIFHWYYRVAFKTLRNVAASLLFITYDLFSIELLLKTLFAPWKRDVVAPVRQEISLLLQAVALNLASRGFGFVVRAATVIVGLIVTVAVALALGLIVLASWILPVLAPVAFVAGFFFMTIGASTWGVGLVAAVAATIGGLLWWYRHDLLANPPKPEPLDRAIKQTDFKFGPYFTLAARRIVKESKDLNELVGNLLKNEQARFIFQHLDFGVNEVTAADPNALDERAFIIKSAQTALNHHRERVEVADLVFTLIANTKDLTNKLPEKKLTLQDVEAVCRWQAELWGRMNEPSALFDPKKLRATGGVGRDWAAGWTPTLDAFSIDWTSRLEGRAPSHHFVAHRNSIERLERILARRSHHNAVLVGEPGTGKRTVVEGITEKIFASSSFSTLVYKRIIELDTNRLLGRASSVGALEQVMVKIFNETVRAGNVILFIDEFDRLLFGEELSIGRVDAGSILQPYLDSPALKLIATTTPNGWHKVLSRHPDIAASFEKIEVTQPSDDEMMNILEEVAAAFEARYRIVISYASLKEVLALSHRFLPEKKLPEKAIDLLDEAAVYTAERSAEKILRPADLDKIVESKTHVAVGPVGGDERELLLNLETVLHKSLINQDYAVSQIADALRRARTGVKTRPRPIGAFLFLGPTGVGKTATAKALANAYFGGEKEIVRFDMSEYDTPFGAERLIGGPSHPGGGLLTRAVAEKPFSLILFDEIDKANENILNLFLQLLDEGRLTDDSGKTVDFTNTIIIATSNAGSEQIRERINAGEQVETFAKQLIDDIQRQGTFRPEFLNRFDAAVVYRPLSHAEMAKVLDIMVSRLNEGLAKEQITITLDQAAKQKLVQLGFDPVYGARALERALTDKVENLVAEKILRQELKPGMSFTVTGTMV
ncbi:MAG: ATP-dependent Clp protease ATP-binding subunit [Patescibacteria group bacterium]